MVSWVCQHDVYRCASNRIIPAMSEFIGPSLPPGLSKTQEEDRDPEANGPRGGFGFGPQLPSYLSKREKKVDQVQENAEERLKSDVASAHYGPVLPSTLKTSTSDSDSTVSTCPSSSYGPMLPPGFEVPGGNMEGGRGGGDSPTNSETIGLSLPPGVGVVESEGEEEEEEEVIGPMPVMGGVSEADSSMRRKREFESRANAMKDKLLGKVAIQLHIQLWIIL